MIEGGYGIDDCCEMVAGFTADGGVDYFSFDIGGNWGAPSYIPSAWHRGDRHGDDWADLCGLAKQATDLPVVYAGRIANAARAAEILAAGQADLVAMARATMADPEHVTKVRLGRAAEVRPCIGLNECIHAHMVDGLPYGCGSNPRWARESEPGQPPAVGPLARKEILVVGGGPGGTEFAGLAAERGHHVHLWERDDHLGGALAIAAAARANAQYRDWITWQTGRLERAGVHVTLGRSATAADILAVGADVVVIATGATPRRPVIDGVGAAHVVQAADALAGAPLGRRVLVISEDDGPAPLCVADHLAGSGHLVTLAFQTPGPSPLVGKYSIGGMLRRLDEEGVVLLANARVVTIGEAGQPATLAHSYSNRRWTVGPFDSVVLACGAVANDGLYQELRAQHPAVHLLGDAYAPRRMIFATRQAWDLAKLL